MLSLSHKSCLKPVLFFEEEMSGITTKTKSARWKCIRCSINCIMVYKKLYRQVYIVDIIGLRYRRDCDQFN